MRIAEQEAWTCLSLCMDAGAMRMAVGVGKEKLGLPTYQCLEPHPFACEVGSSVNAPIPLFQAHCRAGNAASEPSWTEPDRAGLDRFEPKRLLDLVGHERRIA